MPARAVAAATRPVFFRNTRREEAGFLVWLISVSLLVGLENYCVRKRGVGNSVRWESLFFAR